MSDMAPLTTGVRIIDSQKSFELSHRALEIAIEHLKKDGKFAIKVFM